MYTVWQQLKCCDSKFGVITGKFVYLQCMYLENKISLQNKACINKIVVLCEKILIKHVF